MPANEKTTNKTPKKKATKKPRKKTLKKPARKPDDASAAKKAPWKKPNPRPPAARKRLSAAAKEKARTRAQQAGRRYPNLVDNMWAARNVK